jgi:hypothetical protein
MRKILVLAILVVTLAFPSIALGFHHGDLPADVCHAIAAVSPSNDNGQAKEALIAHNPNGLPLAPVAVPGQGPTEDQGEVNCANGHVD